MSGSRQKDASPDEQEGGGVEEVQVEEVPVSADAADELEARVRDLEARLRTVSAAYRQKQDETELTKERLARQAQVQDEIRRGEVVAALFEPLENLHRSVQSLRGLAPDAVHGLEMVYEEFLTALQRLGLEEVPGTGSRFDPSVHEAIATEPVTDPAKEGTVVSVFSTGYRFGTRLIRPARVVIGSYTEPVGEA